MKKRSLKFIIAGAALFACLVGYCIFQREWLTKSFYTFSSAKVSEEFDGFKICHISDLHNKEFGKDNVRLNEAIAEETPDIIVITGDLIDSRHTNIEVSLDFVSKCLEVAPVYYVTGNHEEALTDEEKAYVFSSLEEMGVTLLENESVSIYRGSESIHIGGVFDSKREEEDLDELFEDHSKLNILLFHRPSLIDTFETIGADIVLSGHAHGGQVRIPFVGGLIAPDEGFFPKYTEGMYDLGERKLVVSRGLGNSSVPIRINNPPEIVFVTLKNSTN